MTPQTRQFIRVRDLGSLRCRFRPNEVHSPAHIKAP
jgi:hypothetical protein